MRSPSEEAQAGLQDSGREADQPSLLHGDLWGGNFMVGPDGLAWLIDPAVYVGSAEADIAMTELFGGSYLYAVERIIKSIKRSML